MLTFKKPKEVVDAPPKEDYRHYVPVTASGLEVVREGEHGMVLGNRDRPQDRRVQVDAIGAELLSMLDGGRTLEELIEAFADIHLLSYLESRALIMAWLRPLVQRELVRLENRDES